MQYHGERPATLEEVLADHVANIFSLVESTSKVKIYLDRSHNYVSDETINYDYLEVARKVLEVANQNAELLNMADEQGIDVSCVKELMNDATNAAGGELMACAMFRASQMLASDTPLNKVEVVKVG